MSNPDTIKELQRMRDEIALATQNVTANFMKLRKISERLDVIISNKEKQSVKARPTMRGKRVKADKVA
jgi:hypothetical protein